MYFFVVLRIVLEIGFLVGVVHSFVFLIYRWFGVHFGVHEFSYMCVCVSFPGSLISLLFVSLSKPSLAFIPPSFSQNIFPSLSLDGWHVGAVGFSGPFAIWNSPEISSLIPLHYFKAFVLRGSLRINHCDRGRGSTYTTTQFRDAICKLTPPDQWRNWKWNVGPGVNWTVCILCALFVLL